ncbi:unnamed protein product [Polarella glacialis]|uniref:Uncharacterized protein n=1 Tax=Polarella glacialis TaxID=89957 RepID=A0A813D3H7_POLGL|nr:unnamed protein product [Polarella glacialis]
MCDILLPGPNLKWPCMRFRALLSDDKPDPVWLLPWTAARHMMRCFLTETRTVATFSLADIVFFLLLVSVIVQAGFWLCVAAVQRLVEMRMGGLFWLLRRMS